MKKVWLVTAFFLGLLLIMPMVQASQEIITHSHKEGNVAYQFGLEKPLSESVPNPDGQVSTHDNFSSSYDIIMEEYTTTINQTSPLNHEVPSTSLNDSSAFQIDHSGDELLPDMNHTTRQHSPQSGSTESSNTANSHTGIDHRYIQALPYWTKEGHWFPKTAYSQIRYQVHFGSYIGLATFKAYVKVQRGADTYCRYLRVYLDEGRVDQKIICSGTSEFTFDFNIWWGGTHTLTLEIYWGGWRDYGWKLVMIEVYDAEWDVCSETWEHYTWYYRHDLGTEFFGKTAHSRLEFDVLLGPNSWAWIKIDRHDDTYARFFWIYVDGVKKNGDGDWTPLSKPFYLGEYVRGSLHKLRLEIYWGGYKDCGWKLDMKQFKVFYDSLFVEVDYMQASDHNHKPDANNILNVITDYYKLHGAQNTVFVIDDAVPHVDSLSWNQHKSYYSSYFDHKGQYGWKYMLAGHYSGIIYEVGYIFEDPPDVPNDTMIFIADQLVHEVSGWYWPWPITYEKLMRNVIMHELGHTVGIIITDAQGREVYCPQPYSVMAKGVNTPGAATEEYQAYDWEYWSLRSMP